MRSIWVSRALFVFAMCYLAFLYVPVLLLPLFSFNNNVYVTFPLKGFTTKWYATMVNNQPLIDAFVASVKVGIGVSVVSTGIGILAAMAMTRYRFPGKALITSTIMVPLVIPYIILGVSLLSLARQVLNIDLSLWTISASHVLVCVPLSMLVLMARMEGFDKSLEEASLDLGEGAWRTFWRVTFPLAIPGIISSFLLCFSTSFDEFVLAFFLSGTEPTLPIFMYSLLRFPGKIPGALALASCILLGSAIIIVFAEWYRRRGVQTEHSGIV